MSDPRPEEDATANGLAPAIKAPSPRWRLIVRRFVRRKMAVIGFVLVASFVLLAVIGPLISADPNEQNFEAVLQTPSVTHLLGTDSFGRDVFARIANGARVSLLAGVMATALAMTVGVSFGLLAGFYRGWVDLVIMRITDVMLAFPFLIFAVGLAAILGASLRNVIIALAVSQIPEFIRIARGETMGLREQDFVSGAVADGAGDLSIMARYIAPNALSVFIIQATVAIPTAILGEATLSFLGLGVQPPTASWGIMLTNAQQFLAEAPYLAIFPGVAIALTTLGFNLLGDGLRDVLDPKETR